MAAVNYIYHILIMVAIYIILAQSFDLLAGHTGLLSIAHAAFLGIGAYTSSLVTIKLGAPFLLGLLIGMAVAVLISFAISLAFLRLHNDYFVFATFGFQMILFNVFNIWVDLTGGPMGLSGIPQPIIFGWVISSHLEFLLLVSAFAVLVFWLCHRIVSSPFGRVLTAIREDEVFALAAGKNVALYKVAVFVIGSGMAAIAGALYAHYISFIDPTSFTVMESIFIISIVIIGGAGSLWGPVVGAVLLVMLPEALRFVGMPSSIAANMRQILYGGLLVAFMLWRPQGLVGKYGFQLEDTKK